MFAPSPSDLPCSTVTAMSWTTWVSPSSTTSCRVSCTSTPQDRDNNLPAWEQGEWGGSTCNHHHLYKYNPPKKLQLPSLSSVSNIYSSLSCRFSTAALVPPVCVMWLYHGVGAFQDELGGWRWGGKSQRAAEVSSMYVCTAVVTAVFLTLFVVCLYWCLGVHDTQPGMLRVPKTEGKTHGGIQPKGHRVLGPRARTANRFVAESGQEIILFNWSQTNSDWKLKYLNKSRVKLVKLLIFCSARCVMFALEMHRSQKQMCVWQKRSLL